MYCVVVFERLADINVFFCGQSNYEFIVSLFQFNIDLTLRFPCDFIQVNTLNNCFVLSVF